MNKKLVTLAVAAAMAVPVAAMADATLYGKVNVGINYMDQDMGGSEGFKGWGLSDNKAAYQGWVNQSFNLRNPFITTPQGPANRIGVKGSEDLGNGLKAIYQIELGFSLSDSANTPVSGNETITMRNTFAGLASSQFGTLLAGRHDTPLKISTGPLDLFADTLADYNNTVGFQDLRADNAIAYISPNFSGFTFAGAIHAGGGSAYGLDLNNGTTYGAYNRYSDTLAEAYSLAGIYKNGPWYASLAYEGLNSELICANFTDPWTGKTDKGCGDALDAETWGKWRVGLGMLDWNGFTLAAIYEHWDNGLWSDEATADLWNIQAGYTFGNFMFKGAWGQNKQSDINMIAGGGTINKVNYVAVTPDDYTFDTWTLGVDYNMSKRTKAFLLYTQNTSDDLVWAAAKGNPVYTGTEDMQWNGFQIGLMHNF